MNSSFKQQKGRVLSGTVVSNRMKDTVVVETKRYVPHPKYKKYLRVTKRLKAHDAGNTKQIGEKVSIIECRPMSKEKHFRVLENNEAKRSIFS